MEQKTIQKTEKDNVRSVRIQSVVIIIIGFIAVVVISPLLLAWMDNRQEGFLKGILAIIALFMLFGGGITMVAGFVRLLDAKDIVRLYYT